MSVALLREIDLGNAVGWALLHACWQGTLVWLLYRIARLCTTRPALRYAIGNTCLIALVIAQLLTLAYCCAVDAWPALRELAAKGIPLLATPLSVRGLVMVQPVPEGGLWDRAAALVEPWLSWAFFAWATVLTLRTIRATGAMLMLDYELRHGRELDEPQRACARRACERLKFGAPIRFIQSAAVSVPATAGWLRPVVIVPSATVLKLGPDHLEAMLLHELAHVMRGDFLAHLLRSMVEGIYFFHPLLRRLAHDVAHDAEEATDEIAARACESRKAYLHALVTLEERRPSLAGLLGFDGSERALGGSFGGSLGARVRNLFANHAAVGPRQLRLSAAGPFITTLLVVTLLSQTFANAAADRAIRSHARSQTLAEAVLAEFSENRDRPESADALAAAIATLRNRGEVPPAMLDALAGELLAGVRADLITDLGGLPAGVPLVRGLSPRVTERFGSPAERRVLVAGLRAAGLAARDRVAARRAAQAAICLASLDHATFNAPAHDGKPGMLLLQPAFVAQLQLSSGQQRRLDLAVRALNERGRMMAEQLMAFHDMRREPTTDELARFARVMSLMPHLQPSTALCLPLDVHRALAAFVRNNPASPPAASLERMLRAADAALTHADDYTPSEIAVLDLPEDPSARRGR